MLLIAFVAVFLAGRRSQKDFPDLASVWRQHTTPVYVVRRDISPSESLQQADFTLEHWPTDKVPANLVVTVSELIGAKPNVSLYTGEPLVRNKLSR